MVLTMPQHWLEADVGIAMEGAVISPLKLGWPLPLMRHSHGVADAADLKRHTAQHWRNKTCLVHLYITV